MIIFKNTAVAGIFAMLTAHGLAQADFAGELRGKFDQYRRAVLQEKLFVHTDKSVYLTGETLWFKIYSVDAFFHMPLAVSAVGYVELLDKNNIPVLQAKIALQNGDGDGSLYLPGSLEPGNYRFRAYTRWMKNFPPDYFFQKIIMVINTRKIKAPGSDPPGRAYHIDFFPEGGNLVSGIGSTCAFKVCDQYGRGMVFRGALLSDKGDTILRFSPLQFGMGHFHFTPVSRRRYSAVIIFSDGSQLVKDLPAAYEQGYVMHLERASNGRLEIIIRRSPDSPAVIARSVYLFIHTRGALKWVGRGVIQNDQCNFLIDTSVLGEGISQLTVFDDDKQPVCERLYFQYPGKRLQLQINPDQPGYACRQKINLSLFVSDPEGNPLVADMSVAVYRVDSFGPPDEVNIDNYLWLTSDLVGRIESPGYYFSDRTTAVIQAMDNLMLTQGWRRFAWEDVLQNKKPAFQFAPELKGELITGKITRGGDGLPAKHVDAYLSAAGRYTQFRTAMSDSAGRLRFEMKNRYGPGEIILQTNFRQDSGYVIDIVNPFPESYDSSLLPLFAAPAANKESLLYASINTEAQYLFHEDTIRQFLAPAIDTTAFYGEPDERYLLDNYTRFTTLEEIFREYVKAVNISKKNGRFTLGVIDQSSRLLLDGDPLVLVDGVPVFDIDRFIKNGDPLKMYKLEVVRQQYFQGFKSFDGVLNFTSYAGDMAGIEPDPGAFVLDYPGLQLKRKFYAPEYKTPEQTAGPLPDFRSLLCWAPELKTDREGKASLSFYASDLPGRYAVVLQGLSGSGMTGTRTVFFDVKGPTK
jgi:hypothetical protein